MVDRIEGKQLIRLICWNMQHKRASWRYLSEDRGEVAVALLQEACTPPPEVAAGLDVGIGPWVYKGWSGARAVIGISDHVNIKRIPVEEIIAAEADSAIDSPARLAVAVGVLEGSEQIGLISVESAGDSTERMPEMMLEVQRFCGIDLPYIVGADLTTWWDSDTKVFGEMMRIGLPLIGPHAPTYFNPGMRQRPSDASLQLDYVFASRSIANRLSVRALNNAACWGPSDHCQIAIELQ